MRMLTLLSSRCVFYLAVGLVFGLAYCAEAAPLPYIADSHTLHLWHLDDTNVPTADDGMNPFPLQGLQNGATMRNISAPGFLGAANTHTGANTQFGVLTLQPFLANGPSDNAPAGFEWFGTNGAFTLEAIIKLDVLPADAPGTALDLISMEGDTTERVFNFRITKSTAPTLTFLALPESGISNSVLIYNANIPLTGMHALATNVWFHVAVTYDGNPVASNNLRFYWTRLDSGVSRANQIGSNSLPADFGSTLGDFAIGNDARAAYNENEVFPGLIDEVRISSVARTPDEFVFPSVSVLEASSWDGTNVPANTLDGDLNTRWAATGEGQWITYDLARLEMVKGVQIGFYAGNSNTATFDVLVSTNNTSWQTVLTNAVSSGETLDLQSFEFTPTLARYVRIVGHGNSQDLTNSFTEVAMIRSIPGDSDADGLPDSWEYQYFSNLDQTAYGDPDNDTLPNIYEYLHGLDPTQPNNTNDLDGDGLPDSWEQQYFGNLTQGPNDDPDRDGFDNLVEYQNGCDPTNPNSVPGDTDGDNLPDAWEMSAFGTLTNWAYDDADSDGYNNFAEMAGGTDPLDASSHPDSISPRVAFMNDSIVDTNACLMPTGSTYGRAINGVSFAARPLLTFGGYQYTAWYDNVGTNQDMWLARRMVNGTSFGPWDKFDTGSQFLNGDEPNWDAHNIISLGVCPADGTLHISWDMHVNTLRYRRSVVGLVTSNQAAWGPGALNPEQDWLVAPGSRVTSVTYPMFFTTPTGALQFEYRVGSATAGDHWLTTYNPATGAWESPHKFASKSGSYTYVSHTGATVTSTSRNPYENNNYCYGPDGRLEYTWTYREAAGDDNHDIDYAYSPDEGVTWYNNAGILIADTSLGQAIQVNSPGIIIKVLDGEQLLINQQAQCVDREGRVHVLMLHRRVEPGFEWQPGDPNFSDTDTAYYHYFRDPTTGLWSQRRLPVDNFSVGSRPKIVADAQDNVYAIYVSGSNSGVPGSRSGPGNLVIISASKASDYTDWSDVAIITNMVFVGEPLVDDSRLRTDGIFSVFIQEDGPSSASPTSTPLHVISFLVNVPSPHPVSLTFVKSDAVVVVASQSGHSYQLQATPSLSPANWVDAGAEANGTGGLIGLPDSGGANDASRYYRIIVSP